MDDIRCPMCGKLNPPELDICQYCQARLKPLIISQPPEEDVPGELVDSTLSASEENIPDWLKDLRPQDDRLPEQEEAGFEEELPAEGAGEADWLERLQDRDLPYGEEPAGEESEAAPFIDEDTMLERLSEFKPLDGPEAQEQDVRSAEQEMDTPWISSIEPSDEDELPDWLSEISPQAASQDSGEEEIELPVEPDASQADETLPDWLAEVEPAEEEKLPVWSSETVIEASSVETSEADKEETPETAEEVAEEAEEAVEEEAVEELAGEQVQEETPTWLKELKEDQAESVPPFEELGIEAEEPTIEKAELPEWLVDLQAIETSEEDEAEELPDWLAEGEQETFTEAEKAELPDWLASIEAQEAEVEAVPEDETPEWLGKPEIEEVEQTTGDALEEAAETFEQEEPPEWLADLEKEFSPESISYQPADEIVPPFIVDEEELKEVEEAGVYPAEEAAFEAPSFPAEEGVDFLESIPDWVSEVSSEEGAEDEEFEPALEEADLPSWLEAMRPVESVDLDIVEEEEGAAEQVETSGPLAGLSGILAAESDFARVRKPPAYSVKLHVTESQEARVALLRELLIAEDKQKPLPAKLMITPQYIFRLVIALALILPIAWAVISGGALTPMPDPSNVPAGVLDMRQQIDSQLSANSPVLVAFDYEAGFSGELEIPTRAVISHLMDKGAFLTLVSTTPSGPILAERLINSMNQTSTRQGNPFTSYANLGYVPGGTAGLLSLAQSPQQTVPYTLDNLILWDHAPLDSIGGVADFSMVLVITENPDTARAWIEQVQPFLKAKETPLVLVVSAQAEPLVLPYYEGSSGQVQGLVVGFPGGVSYDRMTGQDSLASGSWDAFSLGMTITVIILVLGIFIGLGSGLFTSGKKGEA